MENYDFKPIFEQQTPIVPKVEVFDENLKNFSEKLVEFAKNYNSPKLAGLAANQLAVNGQRIMTNMCVVMKNCQLPNGDLKDSEEWIVAVNPEIHKHIENKHLSKEGCLTWHDKYIEAERYETISVKYQDLNGNEVFLSANNFEAAVWQHEINHLKGIKEVVIHPKTGKIYGPSTNSGVIIVNKSPKIGRNDSCPCGSGKKYKKCCEKTERN